MDTLGTVVCDVWELGIHEIVSGDSFFSSSLPFSSFLGVFFLKSLLKNIGKNSYEQIKNRKWFIS